MDTINKILHNNFPKIEVDSASNGLVAVEKYSEAVRNGLQYLLIFMDVCMPTMDGMEASKLIRQFEKENSARRTPIFALSAPSGDSMSVIRTTR